MNRNSLELVLGRYDDPDYQTQKHYKYDPYKSNLAIFGLAMSGKTSLLKTLLIRLHQVARVTEKEEIYILDFSNNLEPYQNLPYVSAYFDTTQDENIRRTFHAVEERFAYNVSRLPGKSFTQCPPDYDRPSHITFVLDGLNAFLSEERFTAYHEILLKLARDGLAKGVSVVFTASDPTGSVMKFLSSFSSIIALDLPKDQYSELYHTRTEKPISAYGRGLVNKEGKVYEFQAYFPYNADIPDMDDDVAVRQLVERLRKCPPPEDGERSTDEVIDSCIKRQMKSFTSELTREKWKDYTGKSWAEYLKSPECENEDLVLGLDYYRFLPVKFNLRTARSIAIYGRRAFGKTNLLGLILEGLLEIPNIRFVVWEDGRQGLSVNANTVKRILDAARAEGRLWECTEREKFEDYLTEHYPKEFTTAPTKKNSFWQSSMVLSPDTLEILRAADIAPLPEPQKPPAASPDEADSFTVFLIQSRMFYQTAGTWSSDQFIPRLASFTNTETSAHEKLFIFSDAQPIVDGECNVAFNNCLTHVFLLDDIMRYINNRGQRSVFGMLDMEEIKERFGKCDLGDGFYYDLESGEIQKVRFLKQTEIINEE